jgi:uncharacterized membrane protein YgaE (UPF0421/DUF939 family)
MELLIIILGIVIGCIFMYFVLRPRLKKIQEYDTKTLEQNHLLQVDKQNLENKITDLRKTIENYQVVIGDTKAEIAVLITQEEDIKKHCEAMKD